MLGLRLGLSLGASGGTPTPTPTPSATSTFTATAFPSYDAGRIFQRSSTTGGGNGKGTGTIPVTINATVIGTTNVRMCSTVGGSTVIQGSWAGPTISSTGSQTLSVTGVDAFLGWGELQLQDSTGTWQGTGRLVGMGALFGFAGQSLTVRLFGRQDSQTATYASAGLTPNANTGVVCYYSDGNQYIPTASTAPWQLPGDNSPATLNGLRPNGLGIGQFLNDMVVLTGVNCGGFGVSVGGTELYTFSTGQSNWTQLNNFITRIGNAFEGFVWGQGHSNSSANCPANIYSAAVQAIFAQVTAVNTFSGYGKYVWTIPTATSTQFGTAKAYNNVRYGGMLAAAAMGGTYVHMDTIPTVDGIHQSQLGSQQMGSRISACVGPQYGAASGNGPVAMSATRSGSTVTVTLSNAGQSSFNTAGTPALRVYAMTPNMTIAQGSLFNNRYAISSVSFPNATTMTFTISDPIGDGNALDIYIYYPALANGTTSTDTITDDLGRPLQANAVPVVCAAPVPAGATTPPPTAGFNGSPLNLTGTVTYGAAPGSYGQEIITGSAIATSNSTTGFYPYTVEGWFVCPTITGATQAIFAGLGSGGANGDAFVGIKSTGKITGIFGDGTKTLIAGQRYYVAVQYGPSGGFIYLWDVTAGTATTERSVGAAGAFIPRALPAGYAIRNAGGSIVMNGSPTTGAVDEFAVFSIERYTSQGNFTSNRPTAPFDQSNPPTGMVSLYHCDGTITESFAQ